MPLAKLAIKQPVFITMVLLAVVLVGFLSYINMGVELYPDISAPVAMVRVSFPGASPEDVETLVTKPLEQTLATVNGIDSLSSTSSQGSAMVMVSFLVGYDLNQGTQQIREKLDSFQGRLPSGADTPVLMRFDPSSMPFMNIVLNVSGNPSTVELQQLIEQVIEPRMVQIPGVASASVRGYPTQKIKVELNASQLKALHVTPSQVINALDSENVILPSGSITTASQEIPVRTSAEYKNLDEMGAIPVAQYGTRIITLDQVATITPGLEDKTSFVRYNGENSMVLELQLQSGGNVVKAAELAREELARLSSSFPSLHFTIIQDNSTFIQESDRDVMLTLILGAILAAIIVFLFIRNFRNTLITVAGLPIIVLGTFAVISALGYTRNIITLMALSLSIGLLIDDAIVVRENIFRHMEHGASPREAADKATGEIAFAVMAITLTIVAVFIPVAFTSGMIGNLFKEFGVTVSVAVLISLLEAFTFAPLLTAFFAKPLKIQPKAGFIKTQKGFLAGWNNVWHSVMSGYRHALAWSLRFRWIVVGITLVLFLVSGLILYRLPIGFFPQTDQGQISVGINLPPDTALEKTDQVAKEVEKSLMAFPEVETVYSNIGSQNKAYSGSMTVQLKEGVNTDEVILRLRSSLTQYGRYLVFSKPNQFMGVGGGGPGGADIRGRPVQITIKGPVSADVLDQVADQVVTRISSVKGIRDVGKSSPPQIPQLDIVVDRQRCADARVSAAVVGRTISTLIQGSTATYIEWEGQRTDVVVSLRQADLADTSALLNIAVTGTDGNQHPLSELAKIQSGTGPTQLSRENQQAQITVGANLEGRTSGEVAPDIQNVLADLDLPAGISWGFGGMQSNAQSAYSSLIFAFLLGLIFVYMVLASQFGSFIHPFTVMVALPLAIIGSAFAIFISRFELTMIYMIGIILMMGLATKNSILLVDFIIRYRKMGWERTKAVLEAGPIRLRPIMMTTVAIIIGMVPTALGLGAAGAFRSPMAIAVIGGEISCTLLSLLVIPVIYTLVDDAQVAVVRLFSPKTVYPSDNAKDSLETEKGSKGVTAFNGVETSPRRWRWWFRKKP